ncbi:hypothetical protein GCM10027568_29920 [Humibacter soli]
MSTTHPAEATNPVIQMLRAIWWNLPLLLITGSAVSAAAIITELLTPGITPLACIAWAVIVGPLFAVLQAQMNDIALGCHVRPTSLLRYFRRYALLGMGTWAAPALSAAVGLLALQWWIVDRAVITLAPLIVSSTVFALTLLGAIASLTLGISNKNLRGMALFLYALHIVARRPIPVVAVVAVMGLGFWAATSISASFLLLVPVPVAAVSYAAVWTSASAIGIVPRRTGLSHSA